MKKTKASNTGHDGIIDGLRFVSGVITVYSLVNVWQLGQIHARNLRGSNTLTDSVVKQFKVTKLILAAICAWIVVSNTKLLRHLAQERP